MKFVNLLNRKFLYYMLLFVLTITIKSTNIANSSNIDIYDNKKFEIKDFLIEKKQNNKINKSNKISFLEISKKNEKNYWEISDILERGKDRGKDIEKKKKFIL